MISLEAHDALVSPSLLCKHGNGNEASVQATEELLTLIATYCGPLDSVPRFGLSRHETRSQILDPDQDSCEGMLLGSIATDLQFRCRACDEISAVVVERRKAYWHIRHSDLFSLLDSSLWSQAHCIPHEGLHSVRSVIMIGQACYCVQAYTCRTTIYKKHALHWGILERQKTLIIVRCMNALD